MTTIIKGNIDIVVISTNQYIKLVNGIDSGSEYFKKWSTNEEVTIDDKFEYEGPLFGAGVYLCGCSPQSF